MPTGLQPAGKNMFQLTPIGSAVGNLVRFAKNSLKFVEIVKTMFQQKGYVAAGIKADIKLKKVKIAFNDDVSNLAQPSKSDVC